MSKKTDPTRLPTEDLRWRCDPDALHFETTANVDPESGVVGQSTAWEALKFGLECDAMGQNVYVRGLRGTGRATMVHRLLDELKPTSQHKLDRCYVNNFQRPDRPRLISLAPGTAQSFKKRIRDFADFIANELPKALDADPVLSERAAIQEKIQEEVRKISDPLDQDLRRAGMALVSMQQGPAAQTTIFPLVDGEPVPPAEFFKLADNGTVSAERKAQFELQYREFQKRMVEVGQQVNDTYKSGADKIQEINAQAARDLLTKVSADVRRDFSGTSVDEFIEEIIQDVIDNRLQPGQELLDPIARYGVNVILAHEHGDTRPIIEENTPNLIDLLGTVELEWGPNGPVAADYRGIHAGALLRADRGYLILDVNDVLSEIGAWRALMRTLRTGRLEIVPAEIGMIGPNVLIKPDPIEISVRVILIGDGATYYQLDRLDPDFGELFKVLADFDHEVRRDEDAVKQYAAVISRISQDESLPPFHRLAVASLVEHGARVASRKNKMTSRFGRIADIAREAAFVCCKEKKDVVQAEHVRSAIERTKERASLPSRKFQELVNDGTIIVKTSGEVVGQINGLAVISSGPLTYGFPARITGTIGAGRAGIINIEGRASMSGSIHTKGFHILGGLLHHLLRAEHALAFSASIAFEQSYGGIDGDSASGAETCCLLSALTGIPIRQTFSMTGAIDQHGHIQAIGGVNEKVEGFFDACNYFGLTGDQGTIIPKSNAGDLMLRPDVVAACDRGEFHIHAVENIHQAIEILTGLPAGELDENNEYPEGTVLRAAVEQAEVYWRNTVQSPAQLDAENDDELGEDEDQGGPPYGA